MTRTLKKPIDPDACATMAEVRDGVDAADRALISLIARRFGYMDAAARIKPDRESIRDERRKAEVIANVKAHAAELGMPAPLAAAMWEMLIESSIAYEMIQFDRRED